MATTTLQPYQREFIAFAMESSVLRFGQFTLKSGRQSPYFFNAGLFNTGIQLAALGRFYAAALMDDGTPADTVLFGPAYKGIPLVVTTAIALADHHQLNVPVTYNRKEIKDHGEGGSLVGASLVGQKVWVIDDVITAGTAIRESVAVIKAAGGEISGILVAIDREECGPGSGSGSAVREVEKELGVPVRAIITLSHIVDYLREKGGYEQALHAVVAYRAQYGA